MKAVHARVRGVVQGVGFRYSTRWEAERLGLVGWARNMPDGSVEVWAQGLDAAVDDLCAYLERGPRAAVVRSVIVHDVAADPDMAGFGIRF